MTQPYYNFTLVLSGVDESTPDLEDCLFEANCHDTLINFKNGTVYLDFTRQASNFSDAVISAIKDAENAALPITIISVAPDDHVSASDIAKRLGIERQTVSLWVKGHRAMARDFPKPFIKVMDKSPIWRWHEIVIWLYKKGKIQSKERVMRATFIDKINRVLQERDSAIRKEQNRLLRKLAH